MLSAVPYSATKGPIVRIAWASSLHLQPWVDVQAAAVPPAQAAVEGDVLALLRGLVVPAAVEQGEAVNRQPAKEREHLHRLALVGDDAVRAVAHGLRAAPFAALVG